MSLQWTDDLGSVDWEELSELYRVAPLGLKPAATLKMAFGNSAHRCFVRDEGRLVGVGRALADGVDVAYLCDIALLPSHQGQGLGQRIVEHLLERVQGHKKILLYAAPGKETFYRRFGFLPMKTAMAVFQHRERAIEMGYLDPSEH